MAKKARKNGKQVDYSAVQRRVRPTTGRIEAAPQAPRRVRYEPGALSDDSSQLAGLLSALDAERLPLIGLPLWCMALAADTPANNCLNVALSLSAAYRQLGIEAQPAPVELTITDRAGIRADRYGHPEPYVDEETKGLKGHVGVWLPKHRRFLDPTVVQFPGVREVSPAPVVLPFEADWSDLYGGTAMTPRGDELLLAYDPLPFEVLDQPIRRVREIATAVGAADGGGDHDRMGYNSATTFLQAVATLGELRARVDARLYPRFARLVEIIGTAEIDVDGEENARIHLPGDRGPGVLLDELLLGE